MQIVKENASAVETLLRKHLALNPTASIVISEVNGRLFLDYSTSSLQHSLFLVHKLQHFVAQEIEKAAGAMQAIPPGGHN